MRIAVIFTAHTLRRATLFPQRILLKIRADKQKKKKKSPFFSLLSPSSPSLSLSFFVACHSSGGGGQSAPLPPPPVGIRLLTERERERGRGRDDITFKYYYTCISKSKWSKLSWSMELDLNHYERINTQLIGKELKVICLTSGEMKLNLLLRETSWKSNAYTSYQLRQFHNLKIIQNS